MGQCMSRKAATAFAASAMLVQQKTMQQHQLLEESPEDENKSPSIKKPSSLTKGVATSFGFKRRPTPASSVAGNPTAARRLANVSSETIDNNGNAGDTEPLTTNVVLPSRTPPHRLQPPKKESAGTKVSRFGFRQPNANRLNRVADINTNPPTRLEYNANNNPDYNKKSNEISTTTHFKDTENINIVRQDSNINKPPINSNLPKPQVVKFTLQTIQVSRPAPVRIIETKTAKTLANNNKKVYARNPSGDESTEDSGVGSHCGENIQQLDRSPIFRRNKIRQRNLEMIVAGKTFDVRDLDEEVDTNIPLTLPRLPSTFQTHTSGFVRDRTLEYQRNIDRKINKDREIECERIRRNSLTSSEASSHYDDEKTYRDKHRNEKIPKSFLKPRLFNDSSPPSSDDQMWMNAGEAMADEFSCSFSSSDESKDKDQAQIIPNKITTKSIGSALQTLMTASLTNSVPKSEIRNVILSIEDPKFAAVAAGGNVLLEDETSPVDSVICSYSDACDKRMNKSCSSNSKDINEKLTISSPGSPTNASNSLSLSEGRDFLIDDEIADQPALVFDDTITASDAFSQQTSEATPTLVDSTPKPRRRGIGSYEGSPLVIRNRKFLHSRAGSLDTLSPCESIASDDFMMDFDVSQSSGVEDMNDRTEIDLNSCHYSLDDVKVRTIDLPANDIMRDWSSLLGVSENRASLKRLSSRPTRLLRSRAGTPSSIPDSPRSVEGLKSRTSISQSPLRLSSRSSTGTAYDSDDSAIRVDRTQHSAMQQDVMGIKTMLLKLKRVLHEQADEDFLLRSETHNPFDNNKNGLFNGLSSDCDREDTDDQEKIHIEELSDLRRQLIYLQGQLEDKDRTVHNLQEEMVKLVSEHQNTHSAPASTISSQASTSNAATQTERLRPMSTGPSLVDGSPTDSTPGSLVSASETTSPTTRRSRGASVTPPTQSQKPPSKLWRKPGEPPSPQRYTGSGSPSSIPRRSCSRSRVSQITS